MWVYVLTRITGRRKNEGRTIPFKTFDVPRRGFYVVLIALGVSLLPTLIAFALVGPYGVFVPPMFVVAVFTLFEMRMSKGLQLTRAQALVDHLKSGVGQLHMCGVPAEITPALARIVSSSVPAVRPVEDGPTVDVWGAPMEAPPALEFVNPGRRPGSSQGRVAAYLPGGDS